MKSKVSVAMSVVSAILLLAGPSHATSFVFPGAKPEQTLGKTPAWLPGGTGDDGYVTVTVEVRMPDASCLPLGKKGIFGIGQETMQVVASLRTVGFRSNLNGQSLPIATFDGRSNPGECSAYNVLPAVIIPFARLEKFSDDAPPSLGILVDVKSTTDAKSNLVGAATMALGAAAIFATGGAATTITGLTTTVALPALDLLEKQYDYKQSAVLLGQARADFNWTSVRNGIKTLVIPLYVGETNISESPSAAIARLQEQNASASGSNAAKRLVEIVLSFNYSKTLFDPSVVGKTDLPKGDSLARSKVLSYPKWGGVSNFLQLIAAKDPALLQEIGNASTIAAYRSVCEKTHGILEDAGLNMLDRSIVMKSLIDHARKDSAAGSGAWYKPATINNCFYDFPDVKSTMLEVFGKEYSVVTIPDVQQGFGADFEKWKVQVPPILSDFRQVMMVKEQRLSALSTFNGQADLDFQLSIGSFEWSPVKPDSEVSTGIAGEQIATIVSQTAYPPGLVKLAARGIVRGGCFAYNDASYLNATNYGGHMIFVDEEGKQWHADISLSVNSSGKLRKITLSPLNPEWRDFFRNNVANGGECSAILNS